jgi:hypothetical protein
MRFTADEAFELAGTEDAITLTPQAAARICSDHGVWLSDYSDGAGEYDAAELLGWLGY